VYRGIYNIQGARDRQRMCVCVCVYKYCARGTGEIYVISRGSTHVSGESINSVRAAFTLSRDASSCTSISHVYNTIYYTYPARAGPENPEHLYTSQVLTYISVHNIRHLYIYNIIYLCARGVTKTKVVGYQVRGRAFSS